MFPALRAMARDPEGQILVIAAASAIGIGTAVYPFLEGWSLLDSLYFSVVTLATVGYGDLHPTTDIGKLFTVTYIISGIGILAAFASTLVKHVELRSRRVAEASAPPPSARPGRGTKASSDAGDGDEVS